MAFSRGVVNWIVLPGTRAKRQELFNPFKELPMGNAR
jgi:hypothetical protein